MQLDELHLQKAAERGEPSHVWRAGQQRRLNMIREAAGERLNGKVFVDGCGLGAYLEKLAPSANPAIGLDIEHERTVEARQKTPRVVCGAGEFLPFPADSFDLILSHEVLEHVQDDQAAIREMVRTLTTGGRLVLFCPNRGYPFETHGMYWRGKYRFGNIPLINYLPRKWRDRLAPHVEVYSPRDLERLVRGAEHHLAAVHLAARGLERELSGRRDPGGSPAYCRVCGGRFSAAHVRHHGHSLGA